VSTTTVAGARYTDPQGRFSFVRPVEWRPRESPDGLVSVLLVSDAPRGNVNVIASPVAAGVMLDDIAAGAIAEIARTYPTYRLNPPGIEATTLAGEPARRYAFVGVQEGTPIRFTQIIAVAGGIEYVVTLTAAADESGAFAAQAEVVLDTFAFSRIGRAEDNRTPGRVPRHG